MEGGQFDILWSNANPKSYFWVSYLSQMIFFGPAKTFDTILIFLGIKITKTNIF